MFAVMCEFVVSMTTWRELVMTCGRVHSLSRGLRLRAVSLRYSIELWSSCQWLYDVCASSWTGWSRQPGVIKIYVYIASCTASAVILYGHVRLLEFEWSILYCVHCILYWWFMYMIMWFFSQMIYSDWISGVLLIMLYHYGIDMSYHTPYDCDVDNCTVKCHFVLLYNIWLSYKDGGM